MSTQTYIEELESEARAKVGTLPQRALALTVTDAESYERGAEIRKDVRRLLASIAETFDPVIEQAHKAHKAALDAKKKHTEPLQKIEERVAGQMRSWYLEAEEKRKEEERKAQEEAKRKAEQIALEEAAMLEDEGENEMAAELIAEAIASPPPRPSLPPVVKVAGVTTRVTWKAEVSDLKALCAAVAAGTVPTSYVTANMVELNRRAGADKSEMRVPGVRSIKVTGDSIRR